MNKRWMLFSGLFAVGLAIWGCGRGKQAAVDSPRVDASAELAEAAPGLFVSEAIDEAKSVKEAKASASPDGEIVMRGRIGVGKSPFAEGRAVFTIADSSLPTCTERHGDTCPTPWDYCCEPPDVITSSTATVQVVDAQGKPLKLSLDGVQGLKPTAEVTVRGKVASQAADGPLVVNATAIHVKG